MARLDGQIHENLVAFVLDNKSAAANYRQGREKEWLEFNRLWHVQPKKKVGEYEVVYPDMYQAVETILARLMAMLFGHEPFFKFEPLGDCPDEAADNATLSVHHNLRQVDFYVEFERYLRQLLLYGITVGKIMWQRVWRDVYRYGDLGGGPVTQTVYDGPIFRPVDIFNWYPAPGSANFKDRNWEIETFFLNKYQLEFFGSQKIYHNVERVRAKEKKGESAQRFSGPTSESLRQRRSMLGLSEPTSVEAIPSTEYWGPAPQDFTSQPDREGRTVDVSRGQWCVLTVAEGQEKVLLRNDDSQHPDGDSPYVPAGLVQMMGDIMFAVGVIEPSKSMQYQLNELGNQQLDMISLMMNRPILAEIGALQNPDLAVNEPGALWLLDYGAIDRVKTLDLGSVTPDTFMAVKDLGLRIEQATGARQFFQGGGTGTQVDRTASGMMSLMAAGNERFKNYARLVEKTGLRQVLLKFYDRKQAFMTSPERIKRMTNTGEQWTTVMPEDFAHMVDCWPVSFSEMEQQDFKRGWILKFLQLVANPVLLQILASQGYTANIPKLVKRIYEIGGFQDSSDVIMKVDEMKKRLILSQLGGGQGGGSGAGQMPEPGAAESMLRGEQQEARQMRGF